MSIRAESTQRFAIFLKIGIHKSWSCPVVSVMPARGYYNFRSEHRNIRTTKRFLLQLGGGEGG